MTTTDGEQPDDSFDLMDIPSEMSPPAATSSTGGQSPEPILSAVAVISSPLPVHASTSCPIEYSTPDEKGLKTGATLRSELPIDCLDIRTSSVSNLLDETEIPSVDATPIIIHGTVNEVGKVSVSGRTPPLPDLRATDFFRFLYHFLSILVFLISITSLDFTLILLVLPHIYTRACIHTHTYSTPVRGSMDAGQPDPDGLNPLLTLLVGRSRGEDGNRENRIVNNIGEKKYGEGKPNVNVTTNPLDISLIGTCTDQSNNDQTSDGPGRTTSATSKPRGKPAGKSK